jgi:hypothetical protein
MDSSNPQEAGSESKKNGVHAHLLRWLTTLLRSGCADDASRLRRCFSNRSGPWLKCSEVFVEALAIRYHSIVEVALAARESPAWERSATLGDWLHRADPIIANPSTNSDEEDVEVMLDLAIRRNSLAELCVVRSLIDATQHTEIPADCVHSLRHLFEVEREWCRKLRGSGDAAPLERNTGPKERCAPLTVQEIELQASRIVVAPVRLGAADNAGATSTPIDIHSIVRNMSAQLSSVRVAEIGDIAVQINRLSKSENLSSDGKSLTAAAKRQLLSSIISLDNVSSRASPERDLVRQVRDELRRLVFVDGDYVLLADELIGRDMTACTDVADAVGRITGTSWPPQHIARIRQPGYAMCLSDGRRLVLRRAQVIVTE